MSTDALAALAAFISGAGAVIGGRYALGRQRKRDEEECEKRFAAFREGLSVREELEKDHH